MEEDNAVRVEWYNGQYLTVAPSFELVDAKKPYLINASHVECAVGEWNKEKSKYGLRVFFASGNSVWFEGDAGRSLLGYLSWIGTTGGGPAPAREAALKRYDAAAKSHGSYNFGLG